MRAGKYKGPTPQLRGRKALVQDHELRGQVLAQFKDQFLPGPIPHRVGKPGNGYDEQLPYCFGWHQFPESEFEFERIGGHGVDCNCMECWPEPHSLDQLRRRF